MDKHTQLANFLTAVFEELGLNLKAIVHDENELVKGISVGYDRNERIFIAKYEIVEIDGPGSYWAIYQWEDITERVWMENAREDSYVYIARLILKSEAMQKIESAIEKVKEIS